MAIFFLFKISYISLKLLIFFNLSYVMISVVRRRIMHIKSKVYNNTLYVVLCGELDEHSASHTRITLDNIFSGGDFNQIIIDLSELDFMDSTGIGVLIGRYKKMKSRNIPIFICNPSKHAEKIFKMTGLYEIMDYDT